MQKKDIKSKKPNSTKNKTNSSKQTNKRITPKRNTKADQSAKIACILACVAILGICYVILGLVFTLIAVTGLAIIIGTSMLLNKTKNQKKKRKIINIILIIFLIKADPKFKVNNLNTTEISRMYDKDGNEFAKLGSEKREKISYEELPEVLIDAIISTEDSRFFQHNGFDAPRFFKATAGQLLGNSGAGGASTLSMQVVKNSFTSTEASGLEGIIRKFEDIYLSIFKLEKNYTKQQIIEYYVNNHFLGGNIYGVEEASKAYFGKSVTELNLSEAAILAGKFKTPNYYRPTAKPKELQY